MRTRCVPLLLILVILCLCILTAYTLIKGSSVATNDTRPEQVDVGNHPSTVKIEPFENLISTHLAEQDYSRQRELVKSAALSRPELLKECAREMLKNIVPDEGLAIAHFATAYYQLGGKHDELLSLLQSSDLDLVCGTLMLLDYACEIDADGKWHLERPLGGPEMPSRVARIATDHPELSIAVASALSAYGQGIYRKQAQDQVRVLLQMLLSDDNGVVLQAYFAILVIDDSVCEKFGLDVEPLSEQQKADIKEYLIANP